MRILFFPSDMGGGFGHISRCLALAYEAKHRGHTCVFVINDRKYEKKIRDDFKVFISETYTQWFLLLTLMKDRLVRFKPPAAPLFIEVTGLDYQVMRDGLINRQKIKKKLEQYIKIVKTFEPDVLIGDTNLLVWILSKKTRIPSVQIVRYASHPKTAKLIWWKNIPEGTTPPNSSEIFNPLLMKMGLNPINRAEELLQGDLYIVPSIPEIEPIPEDESTVYVGALTISKINNEMPSWWEGIDDGQPLIYITIGGGAGPVGNKLFFSTLVEAFANKPFHVVVSTSSKFESQTHFNAPKNIRFFKWVPGKFLISKADLVIFHGGYGTMMESIAFGKPTITIPFQSEQEGNGKRLEQLGCGLVVKLSKERFKCIESKWKYGTYTFLVQKRYDLTAEKLSGEVDKILFNPQYLVKAKSLKEKVKEYRGPEKAIELIEKYWS
jgi:UDP:flavonoid glycosyltransferase YjiC (YdhE family)